MSCHPSSNEVVTVASHPGHGNVPCCLATRPIQPDRDVLQGLTLHLLNGGCVASTDGEVVDVVTLDSLPDTWNCQPLPCFREDLQATTVRVIRFDCRYVVTTLLYLLAHTHAL